VRFDREERTFAAEQVFSLERGGDQIRVVFARDRDEDSGARERFEELLIDAVGLSAAVEIPADARDSGFAEDSRPEGVIEVCDDAFFRGPGGDEFGRESSH
jgi:hypothetical protein